MKNRILLTFTILLFITSCKSQPQLADARKAFNHMVTEQSKNNITLGLFRKENGSKLVINGQEIYQYSFTATLNFAKSLYKSSDPLAGPFKDFGVFEHKSYSLNNPIHFFSGSEVSITGDLTFAKTENGWELTQYEAKSYNIVFNQDPLFGSWKLKAPLNCNVYFGFTKITVTPQEVLISGDDQSIEPFDYKGTVPDGGISSTYDFGNPDAAPGANIHRFTVKLSADGKELLLKIPDFSCTATFIK